MSEKKELNKEELSKVSGGGKDGRDGAIKDDKVSGPNEETTLNYPISNDTFYGPAQ